MILWTTPLSSVKNSSDEYFPLGAWCLKDDQSSKITASSLSPMSDLDVEVESKIVVSHLENWVYDTLNRYHDVNLSNDFWKQTLGVFFRVLIPLLIRRHNLIIRAMAHTQCNSFTYVELTKEQWIPNSRAELQQLVNSHGWNNLVFSQLCENLGLLPQVSETDTELKTVSSVQTSHRHVQQRRTIKLGLQHLSNKLSRRSSTIVTQSLLPIRKELELSLRLRTTPYFWTRNVTDLLVTDWPFRESLKNGLGDVCSFHRTIGSLALANIPRIYIEHFSGVRSRLAKLLPHTPSLVFTSNLHMASEEFLMWVADAKSRGTTVVIGQHGGVHCLAKEVPAEVTAEIDLADKYLGWGDFSTQVNGGLKSPALINLGRRPMRRAKTNFQNDLAIILDSPYRYPSMPRGLSADRFDYARLINSILSVIERGPELNVLLRVHSSHDLVGDPLLPLIDKQHKFVADNGKTSIERLYASTHAIITTSIGTSFFQTLYHNIPTLMLVHPVYSTLSEWAAEVLRPLKNSQIMFDNEVELAQHFLTNQKDLQQWWDSNHVQDARNEFLNTFSSEPNQNLRALVKMISTQGSCR